MPKLHVGITLHAIDNEHGRKTIMPLLDDIQAALARVAEDHGFEVDEDRLSVRLEYG